MSNGMTQPQVPPTQPQPGELPFARLVEPARVAPSPPSSRRSIWGCIGVVFLLVLLGISCAGNFLLASALAGTSVLDQPVLARKPLQEKFLDGDAEAEEKILVINIKGPIMSNSEGGLFAPMSDVVSDTLAALEKAEEDPDVKAIVLHVDSPGGTITACEQILDRIKRFRKAREDVPIIAFLGSVAASGGYYVSAHADLIMCHATTITGSIGVIFQLFNVEGLFEKIGLKSVTIKSADKKDIGSGLRQMTEEERQLLHRILMEMYDRFITVVDEGRKNLDREEVLNLADGSIFTGTQAVENGLVDKVGFLKDAIEEAMRLSRIGRAKVIEYQRRATMLDLLMMKIEQHTVSKASIVGGLKRLIDERTPRFMYLWTME